MEVLAWIVAVVLLALALVGIGAREWGRARFRRELRRQNDAQGRKVLTRFDRARSDELARRRRLEVQNGQRYS